MNLPSEILRKFLSPAHASLGSLLFVSSFLLYALTSPGNVPGDTETRWSVARQLIRTGSVAIEDSLQTKNFAVGVDGKRHSVWNPGQAVLFLPFTAFGLGLEHSGLVSAKRADLIAQFLASILLFPAAGAFVVWLFYRLLLQLGYEQRESALSAAALAVLTPIFHYSGNTQEETQVAALLLMAMILLCRSAPLDFQTAFYSCILFGLAMFMRSSSLSMVLPMYGAVLLRDLLQSEKQERMRVLLRWIGAGALGTLPFVVLICGHNYLRFADIFDHGYNDAVLRRYGITTLFGAHPLPTLAAKLFSPGKGLLWYCPIIALAPLGLRRFYRKAPFALILLGSAALGNLVFHSFFTIWAGDLSWGARFQICILPLLLLPLVEVLGRAYTPVLKSLVFSVLVLSASVQFVSVVYNFNLEFWQNPRHGPVPDEYTWNPSESHLALRFRNVGLHLLGRPELKVEQFEKENPHIDLVNRSEKQLRGAHAVNFFPFKAHAMMKNAGALVWALLGLWILLLVLGLASAELLRRRMSSLKPSAHN